MSDYRAPVKEMRFVMDDLAGFKELSQLPCFEEATPDLADAILDEAAKFAGEVLAPLNRIGDQQGCTLTPNGVTTPPGWKEAYKAFCEAGWSGVESPTEFGGQGLPETLATVVKEMVCSANLSFSLGPLLTTGAVKALPWRRANWPRLSMSTLTAARTVPAGICVSSESRSMPRRGSGMGVFIRHLP